MSFLTKMFANTDERYLSKIRPLVQKINSLESQFEVFSDTQLKEKTKELKDRLSKGETLDDLLVEGFALVREASKRTLEQRHFDVQLMAGIALHQHKIVEMRTGEGKTLAATLAAYLNALAGKGVHIITVNDYLARRDTVWMGQVYDAVGLSVACIVHDAAYKYDADYQAQGQASEGLEAKEGGEKERDAVRDALGGFKVVESYLKPCSRKEAYLCDITHGTNNEFGFDYLRDNMAHSSGNQVQRGFYFAILDEVDSILIDESRTPLIISAPDTSASKLYPRFAKIVSQLKPTIDYEIDEERKLAALTENGIARVEKILGVENIYTQGGIDYLHHLEQALRAQALNPSDNKPLFAKDRDYVMKNGRVIIVDEFTGRLMPGRRWSGGLHQAIEAKEGVEIRPESRTVATITFQNYFRLYQGLSGMTGTAATSAEEFDKVYGIDVVCIPTNKPMIRKDLPDRVYKTQKGKFSAIANEIKERHQKGQPILIGTRSIEKNEYLAGLLEREGIRCQILNAKHHEEEGQIIAQAGRLGAVTVATNMAGRGVDIILGGYSTKVSDSESQADNNESYKKWTKEQKKVKELGGLCVIGTERHEARRVDNQLRGRTGRQGDQGVSQFFLSLDDDLLRIFGGDRIRSLMEKLNVPEDQVIEATLVSKAVESAQAKIEGLHLDARKRLLEYDNVMAKHRNVFYENRKEILVSTAEELREKLASIWKRQGVSKEKLFEKEKEIGEKFSRIAKILFLQILDSHWMRHLEDMSWLKDSVQFKGYANINPLVEYKLEGHKMFQEMLAEAETALVNALSRLALKREESVRDQSSVPERNKIRIQGGSKPKRNDPCPCGSGKKYKKCCWPRFG